VFFNLQKVLAFLVMPMGLLWLLLLGLTLWSWRLKRRAFTAALGLTWILYSLAGNPQLGRRMIARLEGEHQKAPLEKDSALEALFVLGGGSEVDAQGRPHLGPSGDRIAEAARLWHGGRVRILVASGYSNDALGGDRDLAQETREIWLGLGIPESAIRVVATPCFNTRQEIAAFRAMCDQQHWTRIGLLTSAFHLPRAMKLARKAGWDAIPLGCDYLGRPRRFRPQELIPQLEGIRLTQLAVWEFIGQAVGH